MSTPKLEQPKAPFMDQLIESAQRQLARQAANLTELTRRRHALQQASMRPSSNVCERGTRYCKSQHQAQWTDKEDDLSKFDLVIPVLFEVHPKCGFEESDGEMEQSESGLPLNSTAGIRAASLFGAYQSIFDPRPEVQDGYGWYRKKGDRSTAPKALRLSHKRFYKCCTVRLCTLKSRNQMTYLGLLRHRLRKVKKSNH